ncbi:porin family protein [Lewinella sp. JB7]|uniref:porin family protein n=1 Tax=Lewinella sp. JB7 TaxID=2962887 RepID=UPI0020C9DD2B|nr:porin family protein [Lewinella sp. JB7]MCP9237457.1 PorT family protein [Lewinella sp. JB7]
MKSPLLLTCALLLASVGAQAQTNPIQFGFQLSPTFSYMGTDNNLIEGDGTNLGLKLGLMAEYYFQDNYSVHTGLNLHFGSGGALRYDEQFTEVNIWSESLGETLVTAPTPTQLSGKTFDYKIQFVEIPLGLTMRTREFGYMRYFVRPSLNLGIVTNSKGSIENAGFIGSDENFDIGKEVNALNLSWGFGGGVEYAVSTQTAIVGGIGFQSGFVDLTRDNNTSLTRVGRDPAKDNSKGKVNSIVILLGVMF